MPGGGRRRRFCLFSPKWEWGERDMSVKEGMGKTYSTSLKRSVSIIRFFFGFGSWEDMIFVEQSEN